MVLANFSRVVVMGIAGGFSWVAPSHGAGDVERGARASRACMACHSFAPGRHMTGPSLAGVWSRRAGTAAGFGRYSEAPRFKTDGSPEGPSAGKPVIVGSGMQGDRAAVVFSRPEEISAFIRKECP